MDFRRVKKRGQVQKVHKTWLSDCGMYRIDWRRELDGVRIKAGFHALVHTYRGLREQPPFKQWDFAGKRSKFQTLEAAIQACEFNRKCWTEAINIAQGPRPGRTEKLKDLEHGSRYRIIRTVKKKKTVVGRQKIMGSLPIWVHKQGNEPLFTYFCPAIRGRRRGVDEEDEDECPSVPMPVSSSSAPDSHSPIQSSAESSIPALAAKVEEKSSIPPVSVSTKRKRNTSPAPIVEEAAKAPAKRASKRTAKSSKTGGKKNSKRSMRTSSDKVPSVS